MKVLITSSRLPYALTEIRELGRSGHEIHAADTFWSAPGNHSRFVTRSHVTVAPRADALAYHEQIEAIVRGHDIEMIVPSFEEVFYLVRRGPYVGEARVYASEFKTIARLHDKSAFVELAADMGLTVPPTIEVRDRDELREAIGEVGKFFARPTFSRAGARLFTNAGNLAGALGLDDCDPTFANPWIVQQFIEGEDVCSFSVARRGRVTAHSTYVHPVTLDHAGGVVFESIDEPRTLAVAQRLVEATLYTGQISFDFKRTPSGELFLLECNPRPTAGVCVMPPGMFVKGLLDPGENPIVAPPGLRSSFRGALIRELLTRPSSIPRNLREMLLLRTPDVVSEPGDRTPGLFQVLSLTHTLNYFLATGRWGEKLASSYLHDLVWNGEPIEHRRIGLASAGAV